MTLSKERLEEIRDYDTCVTLEESAEMARRLLAVEGQPSPSQAHLRQLVDGVWNAATESDEVPSTEWADQLIAAVNWQETQPAPVAQPVQVPDDKQLRELFDAWFASDCSFDRSPDATEEDNIAWRESYWYVWQRCRAAMLQPSSGALQLPNDTKRLDWLDAQNKRLNEYYGTSYGWKFDANFQRNAMMLNDSNYPVMNVRQAIDEAMKAAPQEPTK